MSKEYEQEELEEMVGQMRSSLEVTTQVSEYLVESGLGERLAKATARMARLTYHELRKVGFDRKQATLITAESIGRK